MENMKNYLNMPEIDLGDVMLRTIKKSDFKDMYEYGSDPEVTKWLSWGPMHRIFEAKKSIKEVFLPRIKRGLPVGYAIVYQANQKMIGTIDFHAKLVTRNAAEIGYCLNRNYWGRGIMTKALKKMIEIGFDDLGYDVIVIKHLHDNIASKRVIEKCGFKFVSQMPYAYQKAHGKLEGMLMCYELNKEAYHGDSSRKGNI